MDIDPAVLLPAMRQVYAEMPLHKLLGIDVVELDQGRAAATMPVSPEAFNSTGNLHGGAIATLIDVAAGSAAATSTTFVPGSNHLVTADLHIRYLGRPHGTWVRAEGRILRSGRQLIVAEVRVTDVDDRLIAVADFAGMVVPLRAPLSVATTIDSQQPDI